LFAPFKQHQAFAAPLWQHHGYVKSGAPLIQRLEGGKGGSSPGGAGVDEESLHESLHELHPPPPPHDELHPLLHDDLHGIHIHQIIHGIHGLHDLQQLHFFGGGVVVGVGVVVVGSGGSGGVVVVGGGVVVVVLHFGGHLHPHGIHIGIHFILQLHELEHDRP